VVCPSRANMFSFVPFRCTGGDLILLRIARQGSGGELIGRGKGEGEFGSVGRRDGMVWYLGDEQGFEGPPTRRMGLPWTRQKGVSDVWITRIARMAVDYGPSDELAGVASRTWGTSRMYLLLVSP
jgi:hypothetical protein